MSGGGGQWHPKKGERVRFTDAAIKHGILHARNGRIGTVFHTWHWGAGVAVILDGLTTPYRYRISFVEPLPVESRPAFTLIDLLAVMGIIAVLVGLLVNGISGAREAARNVRCLTDLRTVGQSMHEYRGTWRVYPRNWDEIGNWNEAIVAGAEPRSCPRDRRPDWRGQRPDARIPWVPFIGQGMAVPPRYKFTEWVDSMAKEPVFASDLTVWAGEVRNGVWRDGSARRIK